MDINEIKDHAALSQYLRDNMLYQQQKLKEFLANGNGPKPEGINPLLLR